ncbi:MAG: bifunctional phosphopantothenoylcysteine decarboxylase/phosphopantothenate--cysteine ligase CoaBC [Gammaproteobacteria bacterium]
MALNGKKILIGVCGGIAAYKTAELVRRLAEKGAEVRVVMTRGAQAFITPLTMQAVSGNPVHSELLDSEAEAGMGHIELARWADYVLVAPATANFMAKLAAGLADDLLSTLCLATDAPVLLAPAMNARMWSNAATQANARVLTQRGVRLLGPAEGDLACGEVGAGRMLEPAELLEFLMSESPAGSLNGVRVVVSAGPTREEIDPVRFLSNRSSGKMGYAVAGAAQRAGARVTLVSGPVALETPPGVKRIDVESAGEMYEAVMACLPECDIYIGAAAVADYRPVSVGKQKIKKERAALTIALERTEDILAAVARAEGHPFTVGFAAETEKVEEYARAKLEQKGLAMIAANRVGAGQGFEADDNALTVLWPGGKEELPRGSKRRLAEQLVNLIAERYHAQDSGQGS